MFHVTVPKGGSAGLVRFGSVRVEDAGLVSHRLLDRILYGPGTGASSPAAFFCVTRTQTEISFADDSGDDGMRQSLVVGAAAARLTPDRAGEAADSRIAAADAGADLPLGATPAPRAELFPHRHVPAFVSEGDLALDGCGLVARMSRLLRQHPILYHSTVLTDYLFVAEPDATAAIGKLTDTDGVSCGIETGEMDTLGSADPAAAAPGDDNQPPPTAWPLAVLPLSVALFSMDPSALRPCAFQIMTMLFHGDATQARDPTGFGMRDPRRFASLAITPDEVSLVLDQRSAALFPEGALRAAGEDWAVIRIGGGDEPDDTGDDASSSGMIPSTARGIVAAVSAPLAEREIPMLYLSTCGAGHVLAPVDRLGETVDILREAGFTVQTSAQ